MITERKSYHTRRHLFVKRGRSMLCLFFLAFVNAIAIAQPAITDSITHQLEMHRQRHLQEKLYVHMATSFYTTGSIIWFKVYAVDGYRHQPLHLSKVAYVEVLNEENSPVLQAKVALNEGFGSGSFLVPQSINTGSYTLRAYTAWMKNFDADYFFHQPITIVNTLKRPDWQKLQQEVAYDFQLYPEGGNLVQGLESRVAFRVVNQDGQGQEVQGVLLNAGNDTLQQFRTRHSGMGSFSITPQQGQQYTAVARLHNGQLIARELPQAFEQGVVMAVRAANPEQVSITVTTNTADRAVYLLVHCRQLAKVALAGTVVNGKASFILNKKELGDGINHFTIFNAAKQPLCERLYFNRPGNELTITAQTNKQVYTTREKVDLALLTQRGQQTPVSAQLSLSVHLADSLQANPDGSIVSYLLLTSDLKGAIENPGYYFTSKDPGVEAALDYLMLTHGWRRFKWEEVIHATPSAFAYLPEYESHIINATVTHKGTGQAVGNIPVFLAVPGTQSYIGYAVSNKEGRLRVVVPNIQGAHGLVAQVGGSRDSLYRVAINSPFSGKWGGTPAPAFVLAETQALPLATRNLSAQVQNNFRYAQYQQFVTPAYFDTTGFYGQPDKTYYLDEYTRFVTMEEVMREYVKEVRVRKQSEGFRFEVLNTPYKLYFDKNPLVLLDGVPLFDINKVMAVDPLRIRKIEVVARKYFLGALAFDGIVSYSSYKGNLTDSYPDAQALLVAYEGTQLQREFYAPVYETAEEKNSRLPDFRSQLHWAPEVQTDAKGQQTISFYTSDLTGDYIITIQGLTADGLPGSTSIRIKVNK